MGHSAGWGAGSGQAAVSQRGGDFGGVTVTISGFLVALPGTSVGISHWAEMHQALVSFIHAASFCPSTPLSHDLVSWFHLIVQMSCSEAPVWTWSFMGGW